MLEDKTIGDHILMEPKDVREVVYKLMKHRFVTFLPVPKRPDNKPESCVNMWVVVRCSTGARTTNWRATPRDATRTSVEEGGERREAAFFFHHAFSRNVRAWFALGSRLASLDRSGRTRCTRWWSTSCTRRC